MSDGLFVGNGAPGRMRADDGDSVPTRGQRIAVSPTRQKAL